MAGSRRSCIFLGSLVCVLFTATGLMAQWSTDPMVNLAIADRPSEQVTPKVATTSDGGCYIAWFDHASGNYDVYLQRLDPAGNEMFPHNGILISNHAQDTSLVDWDIIADSDDHCVLVFTDIRNGPDLDVYGYRIAPDGTFDWGPDGVTLSDNSDFEPAPRVVQLSDGDFMFVWARLPDVGDGKIVAQRVSPAGVPAFPAPVEIAGDPGESPGFVEIVPSDNSSFIAVWVRDISSFASPRYLRAQKYASDGTPQWGSTPVSVFDAISIPIAYTPQIVGDGAGGAVIAWHRSTLSGQYGCFVQQLDSSGNEVFPHNGVEASTNTAMNHIDPTLSYDESTGEIFLFWKEENLLQSMWGIYGQKFSSTGARMWTDNGTELLPVDNVFKLAVRSVQYADGAMVFLINELAFNQDQVLAMRVDGNGDFVWPGSPLFASSALSGKGRLPVVATPSGSAILVWEDNRGGTTDVYAQNVNTDGTLGYQAGAPLFVRGDCNDDGANNIADAIFLLGNLFPGTPPPPPITCDDACDCNDDGQLNIADAITCLNSLFGNPAVPLPAPNTCGPDPTTSPPDVLDCSTFSNCP